MVRLNARAVALTGALMIVPAVAGCGYNTIPTKQERAEAAWADVQSQYQRRADLVPNLVATVQGAAIQERTTLTDVINARARATSVNVSADWAAAVAVNNCIGCDPPCRVLAQITCGKVRRVVL